MATLNPPSRSRIVALASAFPAGVLTNEDLAKIVDTSDAWIRERTGIVERRQLAEGQNNSDIAAEAALGVLQRAGKTVADVDLIIACTNTPDRWLPSLGATVQAKIGAHHGVPAYDVVTACAGWLAGIQMADALIRTGHYRHVLVVGSEALTRFLDWSDRNTCVLFGDGAGAALVGPAQPGDPGEILDVCMHSDGRYGDLMDLPAGGTRRPATLATAAERAHCIHMDGQEVFNHAVRDMVSVSREILDINHLTIDDVAWFVPHQANLRIIQAVARRLRVPEHKVALNIHKYGNTSTATIPTCLDEYVQAGRIRRGDLVLMCVFGGGLTWAAGLVRW